MPRNALLAVLVFAVLLSALPASAATLGQSGCPDASLAAILDTPGAGGEAILSPMADAKNKVCIYTCDPWGFYTGMHRGTGSSCTAAHNALVSAVGGEASSTGPGLCNNAGAAFGYCGFNLIVTVACHWDFVLGTYVEDGYGEIKCKDYC